MKKNTSNIKLSKNISRILLATIFILAIPLIAMQFTNEVDWDLFDFIVAGTLLIGTGLIYELAIRKLSRSSHRIVIGVALLAALLFVWAELAVGIL